METNSNLFSRSLQYLFFSCKVIVHFHEYRGERVHVKKKHRDKQTGSGPTGMLQRFIVMFFDFYCYKKNCTTQPTRFVKSTCFNLVASTVSRYTLDN